MTINKDLAKQRGISKEYRAAIEIVQEQLNSFLQRPAMYCDAKTAPYIVAGFEYVLQRLWGFPMDSDYHRYSYDLKGCTCPKMDNMERVGTPYRVHNGDCPFHGRGDDKE